MSDKISDEEVRRLHKSMDIEEKIRIFLKTYVDANLEVISRDFPNINIDNFKRLFDPDFVSVLSSYLNVISQEKLTEQNIKLTEQTVKLTEQNTKLTSQNVGL